MTWKELEKALAHKNEWSFEDAVFYTEMAFDMFETEGFCDTFIDKENPGGIEKPFKIIRRMSYITDNWDLEWLPAWLIEVDGEAFPAFPDEICKAYREKHLVKKVG